MEALIWVAVIIVLSPLLIEAVVLVVGAVLFLSIGAAMLLARLIHHPRKRKEFT